MLRLVLILFSLLISLSSCSKEPEEAGPGTIGIGEFRFSGSAESGQYAPQLFKLNRVIGDQFAHVSGWSVLEKESLQYPEEPKLLDKIWAKIFDEQATAPVPKIVGAEYIIIGEMDSFDISYNEGVNVNTAGGEQVISAVGKRSWIVRSRVNMRIVDTKNQKWLDNQVLMVEEVVSDEGNVEHQINIVLERIAQQIVSNTLLSISGYPQVAGTNSDGSVILNRGSQHGIAKGMKFTARHAGTEVKNPENGKILKSLGRQYGTFEITDIQTDSAVAKFSGSDTPVAGDFATIYKPAADKQTKGKRQRNIRVAVGGFFPSQNVKALTDVSDDLILSLDKAIGTRLGRLAGISVVDQQAGKIKQMLAQQALTDLGKDKVPGLPMGTLSGVDYLVFGDLISIDIKKQHNPLKQMGVDMDAMLPYVGELRAFLYLQDVNTGVNVLSEEIRINHKFKSSEKGMKGVRLLFDKFSEQASQKFLFGIRPLRVEWVDLDGVLFNHGADSGIKVGDKFEAFTKGEQQIDPYTGATMQGMGVSLIARLEVTGFAPQGWARAKCIAGQITEKGAPLRPMPPQPAKLQPANQQTVPATIQQPTNQNQSLDAETSSKKKLVLGGIVYSPLVEKSLGRNLLNQIVAEAQSALTNKLHHNSEIVIVEQNNQKMKDMLKQRYLSSAGEPDLSDLMQGITGGDYILYTNLTSAYLDEGKTAYSKTLGENVQGRSTLYLQASINIHNVQTNQIAAYETIKMSKRWDNNKAQYVQWSEMFAELMDKVLSKTISTLNPTVISWVNGNMVGLNQGAANGIKLSDTMKIYHTDGTGGIIAQIEVTGFGPKGLAEARIVDGNMVSEGMLVLPIGKTQLSKSPQGSQQVQAPTKKLAW